MRQTSSKIALGLILLILSIKAIAFQTPNTTTYLCANGSILTYFKRPTVTTSACPVPYGMFSVEGGVRYNEFYSKGDGWTYPLPKVRIGLPWLSELAIVIPSEMDNSHHQTIGLTPVQLALKHDIAYNDHWNVAARVVYIPPSGSKHFGTAQDGYSIDGVLAYRINTVNITAMLGASSLSTPKGDGGKRFNTINPSILLGWFAQNWLEWYGEIYGQTSTGPHQGPGYNLDTGVLLLVKKYVALDMEIGKRLSGQLGNINTYYGGGISFMF